MKKAAIGFPFLSLVVAGNFPSFFPAFDGFFRLKDSNEFTLINLLKWRSSSMTLVKLLLDVDDPPCCLWSQQLNL